MKLDRRVVLVTGGARGQGAAISRLVVAEGGRVVLGDVLDDEGRALAAELGDGAAFVHLDVTDPEQWAAAVSEAQERFGPVDGLVNNAGITYMRPLNYLRPERFREVLEVNLVGSLLGIQAVMDTMMERRTGSIVNTSSVNGHVGGGGIAAYSSSKFGLLGLTRTAAIELGPYGIRVNAVCPGPVDTAMVSPETWGEDLRPQMARSTALRRIAQPEEIARTVIFLLSDDASFTTGADMVVDGGLLAGPQFKMPIEYDESDKAT